MTEQLLPPPARGRRGRRLLQRQYVHPPHNNKPPNSTPPTTEKGCLRSLVGERSSPEGDGGSIDRRTRPHASGTSCNTSTPHLSNVLVRCGPQKQTAVQKGKQNPTPVDPPE